MIKVTFVHLERLCDGVRIYTVEVGGQWWRTHYLGHESEFKLLHMYT
jgi:hypothetical protein